MAGPVTLWEQRWHPLRREWVIVAAHRQDRPWSGETVAPGAAALPRHDPSCYLCPGNARSGGARNPDYEAVFVFDNDHPCVGDSAPRKLEAPPPGMRNRPATGVARVVCYTPRHDLSLGELGAAGAATLLDALADQYVELGARPDVEHVLVFENRGEAVGVSNPHPHCQIYATNFVFKTIEDEARACAEHRAATGRVLMADIVRAERDDGRRVLAENDSAIAFVPYFARWAYEVYVVPKQTHPSLAALAARERADLAELLVRVATMYDNLWRTPFPYVMPLHQAPTDGRNHAGFHFHVEFHPPLRKPGLRKFLAGPEIGGGNFLADTSPEAKAAELRATPPVHYRASAR
jgi:UDPglucose--hexose-1-phosphate uridylyltransferase